MRIELLGLSQHSSLLSNLLGRPCDGYRGSCQQKGHGDPIRQDHQFELSVPLGVAYNPLPYHRSQHSVILLKTPVSSEKIFK